jgi:hypothetical protein
MNGPDVAVIRATDRVESICPLTCEGGAIPPATLSHHEDQS